MDSRSHEGPTDVVDCSVVIVTFNSGRDLGVLLTSLPDAAGPSSIRIIVVDNGSTDDTVEIAERSPDVTCVRPGANLGYAGGINAGRARAGACRAVLVLNPDLRLEPGSIPRLLAALQSPGVGAAVARLVATDGTTQPSLRRDPTLARAVGDAVFGAMVRRRPAWSSEIVWDPTAYRTPHNVDWATGAAIAVATECDRSVGDWDESFFMYSEEVDYALRIRRAGFRIRYVPDAVAVHTEGGSGRSPDLTVLLALNRVRLYRKYHGPVPSAAFRLVVAIHELSRFWSEPRRRSASVVLGLQGPPTFPGAPPISQVAW